MITIVLLISRIDFIDKVFNCLSELGRPKNTELLLVVDGASKELQNKLNEAVSKLNYKVIKIIDFISDGAEATINERRYRISDLHNYAKENINQRSDYVFICEDDTLFEKDTLMNFKRVLDENEEAGFIEGVQVGRHGTAYIGGWVADDIHDPKTITSVNYDLGIKEIDAGGLYCCLVRADLYLKHTFKPFDTLGNNGLSCDVNFGLSIRKKDLKCLISYDDIAEHLLSNGKSLNINNVNAIIEVSFNKKGERWIIQKTKS